MPIFAFLQDKIILFSVFTTAFTIVRMGLFVSHSSLKKGFPEYILTFKNIYGQIARNI